MNAHEYILSQQIQWAHRNNIVIKQGDKTGVIKQGDGSLFYNPLLPLAR